ncbi:hypothetical protein BCR34DRAFT_180373 [Clohesyomyces aquaticus]|uniref:Alpha-mannosyltransferase alg11p n=1 Tax=Clohesyomyces aquaticus TaxID=1231657 RepID=A0A1Y1YEP6_9PLEO|nr:hypothetical protein BCR34DRAFT_180373 [Clohesyomyces aquaticus]
MVKKPIPEGWDSNLRPILIFLTYMGLCFSLTVFIIGKLTKSYNVLAKSPTAPTPPRKHILLFIFLAIGSLGITWFHMIQYFQWSYAYWKTWRSFYELSEDKMHWGLWLRDTSLFKEAWEIAIVGHARYWWTHQIFLFASGLGLVLDQRGTRRGIKHTWAFMLLGQIVAISFATNLFLLAVLVSPPPIANPTRSNGKNGWLAPWLVNALSLLVTLWSAHNLGLEDVWHSEDFMLPLLLPHIALMLLPVARAVLPARHFTDGGVAFSDRMDRYSWIATLVGGGVLFLRETVKAHGYGGVAGLISAIREHPAVRSVGWDVVCCWISWAAWLAVQYLGTPGTVTSETHAKEAQFEGVGVGSSVMGDTAGGEVRRR